jgi:hypothetical protein
MVKLLIDQLGPICEISRRKREDPMAVAECPNCKHDIQTPEFRFFRNGKAWKDFHCPYCRAELTRHVPKWPYHLLTAVSTLAVLGVSHRYLKYAQFVIPFAALVWIWMHFSRPPLEIVTAPHDAASELRLRHAQNQSETVTRQDFLAGKKPARDNSADLTFLRLR